MNNPTRQEPRLLALDVGSRRTGMAVSDELGMFAHPRPAILMTSARAAIEAVASAVDAESVAEVVVGLPLGLSGQETAQTAEVRAFADALRMRLAVPVSLWDERLSSVEASRVVGSRRARSGDLDSAAAAIILQAVLDSRRLAASR